MNYVTDEQIFSALRSRFKENQKLMNELQQVNKKLEESEALKSQFLSNIRNEINNPFAAIMGLSHNILQMKQSDYESILKSASMIFGEAFKLDFQLKNIFAAAEIEAGEVFPQVQPVDVTKLLKQVIEQFWHKADEKGIHIYMDKNAEEIRSFNIDGDMLRLIVSNLVCNAIEFSAEESEVFVSGIQLETGLLVTVEDEGIGIDPADQQIIFDRFTQLDHGSSKHFQGHGLGLSVAKSYTEILNGEIKVESLKNGGSKFNLFLPVTDSLHDEDFSTNEDGLFL